MYVDIICPYVYMYYTMLTLYSIITTQIPELVNSNYMYNHVFHPQTLHSRNLQPVTLFTSVFVATTVFRISVCNHQGIVKSVEIYLFWCVCMRTHLFAILFIVGYLNGQYLSCNIYHTVIHVHIHVYSKMRGYVHVILHKTYVECTC